MEDAIEETLKAIGWDTGFRLPIANEENQKLERELALLVIKKSNMTKTHEEMTTRLANLRDHLKYVRQEVAQNQQLHTTYRQQLEHEHHKLKLRQAEKDKINNEIRAMAKTTEDVRERLVSKRALLARSVAKLEKVRAESTWDAQAMRAWEEAQQKHDADNELLERFSAEDRRKMVALEGKRQSLQAEVHKRRDMVAQMDVDVSNAQHVLERTGKILAELKEERAALVRQWQEAVKNLSQKDADVRATAASLDAIQESINARREDIADQQAFLASEHNDNKYINAQIGALNITLQKQREELHQVFQEVHALTIQEADMKKALRKLRAETQKNRIPLQASLQAKKKHEAYTKKILAEIEMLTDKRTRILERSEKSSKNADLIQDLISAEQRKTHVLERKMSAALRREYNLNSDIDKLLEVWKTHTANVSSLEKALDEVRKRTKTAFELLVHKKQGVSDLAMKVTCLQAQLGNDPAQDLEDYFEQWQDKIAELTETLQHENDIKSLLQAQIIKLAKENFRLVNTIASDTTLQELQREKLQSLCLQIQGGQKQAHAAQTRTNELQVYENVARLKVDKMQKAMANADKKIYDLERYTIELAATISERHVEVMAARDVLWERRKSLEEDRGRLRADIVQRKVRLQQLENKYNISLGMLGKDDNGETMTLNTMKLKAEQERVDLVRESETLTQVIRTAEQDVVAMENTLKIVDMTNNAFKSSVTLIDQDSREAEDMRRLEELFIEQGKKLKERKAVFIKTCQEVNDLQEQQQQNKVILQDWTEKLHLLEEELERLQREEKERQQKIGRANTQIQHCKKRIETGELERHDKDLYIRQLQESNKNTLNQLVDFGAREPEVSKTLTCKLAKEQLEMPKLRTSFSVASDEVLSLTPGTLTPQSNDSKAPTKKTASRILATTMTSVELQFDDVVMPAKGLPGSSSTLSQGSHKGKN